MDASRQSLASAATSTQYNIALQVAFRLVTFLLNGYILRHTTALVLGVVNVRLTLLYSTILFLSREAFRKAVLSSRHDWRLVNNLVWLSVPVGVAWATVLSLLWIYVLETPSLGGYASAVLVFAACAVAELTTEPLWLLSELRMMPRLKVAVNSAALLLRCLVVIVSLFFTNGIAAFCAAQLAQSLGMVALFYWAMAQQARQGHLPVISAAEFLPSPRGTVPWYLAHPPALRVRYAEFLQQAVVKQFLTEGERYIMTFVRVLSLDQQGIFDAITNLGTLPARTLFQPIEESYFSFFARLLAPPDSKEGRESEADPARDRVAARTLTVLLKATSHMALIMAVFGQTYSTLALDIYGGSLLSHGDGPTLMRAYAVYTVVLAVNGITELFSTAISSVDAVRSNTRFMVLFSLAFLFAAAVLTSWFGSVGFIYANMLNMSLRIARSGLQIQRYFDARPLAVIDEHPLIAALPRPAVVVALAAAWLVTAHTEQSALEPGLASKLVHIAAGGVMLIVVMAVTFITDRGFVTASIDVLMRRRTNTA